jgi:hypothetical protein
MARPSAGWKKSATNNTENEFETMSNNIERKVVVITGACDLT